MANFDYDDFITRPKYTKVLNKCNATRLRIERCMKNISKLSSKPPNKCTFESQRETAREAIKEFNDLEDERVVLIDANCIDYEENDTFINEEGEVTDLLLRWDETIGDEQTRVDSVGMSQASGADSLLTRQTEILEALQKSMSAPKAPRVA